MCVCDGGIARFVLEVNEDNIVLKCLTELEQAVSCCNTRTLVDIVGAQDRDEERDMILHRTVVVEDDGTHDYWKYNFEFASKYVESKVFEAINQKVNIQFLHDYRGQPHVAALRRSLFKSMAHDLLARGGKLKICKLVQGNRKTKEKIKRRKKVQFRTLDDIPADWSMYLLPDSSTFKAVDAIAPPDSAFQTTVDTSCTIHSNALKDILKFCKPPSCHFRLYIGVPGDTFDDFMKMQTCADCNKKTTRSTPPSVDQYALCIPLYNNQGLSVLSSLCILQLCKDLCADLRFLHTPHIAQN